MFFLSLALVRRSRISGGFSSWLHIYLRLFLSHPLLLWCVLCTRSQRQFIERLTKILRSRQDALDDVVPRSVSGSRVPTSAALQCACGVFCSEFVAVLVSGCPCLFVLIFMVTFTIYPSEIPIFRSKHTSLKQMFAAIGSKFPPVLTSFCTPPNFCCHWHQNPSCFDQFGSKFAASSFA